MVSYFGMSEKVGNISFYDSNGQSDFSFTRPYSEKTAELIDKEVNKIVEEQYVRAKKILRDNLKGLVQLADQLLEKEVIFSEDLEKIFGKRKEKETLIVKGREKNKSLPKSDAKTKSSQKSKVPAKQVTPDAESKSLFSGEDLEPVEKKNKKD
jgi:AFG3 family protein